MSYLLDTCVLSEYTQKRPDPKVMSWVDEAPEPALHISVLSVGEIRQGATHVADARKSARIETWLQNELLPRFERRVLPVDMEVALAWGALRGRLLRKGNPVSLFDSLIAATASVHGFSVVTRNTRDFQLLGVRVVNPWE